jgi:hypothetical protein
MKLGIQKSKSTGNNSCDIMVTEAVLQYYECEYNHRSLLIFLRKHSYGSLITEVAECLLKHGVQTTLVSANPNLFLPESWNKFALLTNPVNPTKDFHINEMIRVMDQGVMVRGAIPNVEIIENELDQERPVIISCNYNILHQIAGEEYDYALITGYDDKNFFLIEAFGKKEQRKYPKQVVMYAIHSLTAKNPLAGSIILTRKRTPEDVLRTEKLNDIES